MKKLLSVAQASKKILANVKITKIEIVKLNHSFGRTLAKNLKAKRTQPPFATSAMDGYAIRAHDKNELTCIGTSAAGHRFNGTVKRGECVRIFTGAPMPNGADTILIQEYAKKVAEVYDKPPKKVAEVYDKPPKKVAEVYDKPPKKVADKDKITFYKKVPKGKYVRKAGGDFFKGDEVLKKFQVLGGGELSLLAAMNYATVPVQKKPIVAIIASGDELVEVGKKLGSDQIISSNAIGVAALIEKAGGQAINLGIAKDTISSLQKKFNAAQKYNADIVLTLGGASVGEHDLVREVLQRRAVKLEFWKLAMRPGKPVMFGKKNACKFIGLPGNPVSSLVCTQIFVLPLVRAMLGLDSTLKRHKAILGCALPANDEREEYMRATSTYSPKGRVVIPVKSQDSSLLRLYTQADCLLIRPCNAAKMAKGSPCQIIDL